MLHHFYLNWKSNSEQSQTLTATKELLWAKNSLRQEVCMVVVI